MSPPPGSGREAAELASRRDFDVVLSDLGLPDIPGDVLIRQILAHRPADRTRVHGRDRATVSPTSRAPSRPAPKSSLQSRSNGRAFSSALQRPDLAASA